MKNIVMFLLGLFVGTLLTGILMYSQIQNRYVIGQNNGLIQGKREVFNFLRENIQNDQSIEIEDKGKYLSIKENGLRVVEINGVKTIGIID